MSCLNIESIPLDCQSGFSITYRSQLMFNKVLSEVIRQVLKREPTKEDVDKFVLGNYIYKPEETLITFEGALIGRIITNITGQEVKIEFIPES